MARDVLNLAREQAIKYNLSNLKIYTVYMRDGYYYDYTFEDDMLYFLFDETGCRKVINSKIRRSYMER